MNLDKLRGLLERVRRNEVDVEDAVRQLKSLPFEDLGFAKIDSHRGLRCGFPEVVFCLGKRPEDVVKIAERLIEGGSPFLATRVEPATHKMLAQRWPDIVYNELAKTAVLCQRPQPTADGLILVVSAGTSDIPVAEEARVTAEVMGNRVKTIYDAGVAGIHRLLHHARELSEASVIIVVAGMEGALASVVGGLVACPVIAVPTSVGYGASFGGIAPLLTMLNSCAAGVAVVNIDNGFGAGYIASLINRCRARPTDGRTSDHQERSKE